MAPTAYEVEGSLLEACSCGAPCPCWVGDDPHGGKCDAFLAYRIDRGRIGGVDVSGLAFALVAQIPGSVLKGNWRVAVYMSDKAKPPQKQAILDAWTGKLGGPLADVARLIGEVVGVHDAPVAFQLDKGKGTLKVGACVEAEMAPAGGTRAAGWQATAASCPATRSLCSLRRAPGRRSADRISR